MKVIVAFCVRHDHDLAVQPTGRVEPEFPVPITGVFVDYNGAVEDRLAALEVESVLANIR